MVDTTTGFGAGTALGSFTAQYQWYTSGSPSTPRTSPLKIGIQTSDYGSTGNSTRTGENNWDKLLVQVPTETADTWLTQTISWTTGLWFIVDRTTGTNSSATPLTLEEMYNANTLGFETKIDQSSAKIVSLEFGLGSGQRNANNYISYLQTSIYNGGDRVTFAAVPEPSTFVLAGTGLLATFGLHLRRRRRLPNG